MRAYRRRLSRSFWVAAGSLSLALGVAGAVLPLLPTTPFVLLSAFCYARGSERLHGWLATHPRFGPGLEAWRRHGAISPTTRYMAFAAMALALAVSLAAGFPSLVIALQLAVMAGVAAFILSRPSPPR